MSGATNTHPPTHTHTHTHTQHTQHTQHTHTHKACHVSIFVVNTLYIASDLGLECFHAYSRRREDGYAEKGHVISAPWKEWMAGMSHSYDYASVITAFPTDDYDQGWHRDTPDNKESTTVHQVAWSLLPL